jgi:hypothetical protein
MRETPNFVQTPAAIFYPAQVSPFFNFYAPLPTLLL